MKLLDKMHKYKTMLPHCLKCKKKYRKKIQEFKKLVIIKQCYYVVKNQDLFKSKKQTEY